LNSRFHTSKRYSLQRYVSIALFLLPKHLTITRKPYMGSTGTRLATVTSDGSKAGSSYNSVPLQANYAQPCYWAPFILMGNWK
jgi:CHAT domain-containing protein